MTEKRWLFLSVKTLAVEWCFSLVVFWTTTSMKGTLMVGLFSSFSVIFAGAWATSKYHDSRAAVISLHQFESHRWGNWGFSLSVFLVFISQTNVFSGNRLMNRFLRMGGLVIALLVCPVTWWDVTHRQVSLMKPLIFILKVVREVGWILPEPESQKTREKLVHHSRPEL